MERRERDRRSPQERTLATISTGLDSVIKELQSSRSPKQLRRHGYEMLAVLPPIVTELYLAPDVTVNREPEKGQKRVSWNLMRVDLHAVGIATQIGKEYPTKFFNRVQ